MRFESVIADEAPLAGLLLNTQKNSSRYAFDFCDFEGAMTVTLFWRLILPVSLYFDLRTNH